MLLYGVRTHPRTRNYSPQENNTYGQVFANRERRERQSSLGYSGIRQDEAKRVEAGETKAKETKGLGKGGRFRAHVIGADMLTGDHVGDAGHVGVGKGGAQKGDFGAARLAVFARDIHHRAVVLDDAI